MSEIHLLSGKIVNTYKTHRDFHGLIPSLHYSPDTRIKDIRDERGAYYPEVVRLLKQATLEPPEIGRVMSAVSSMSVWWPNSKPYCPTISDIRTRTDRELAEISRAYDLHVSEIGIDILKRLCL
jgi:hypothetical protein